MITRVVHGWNVGGLVTYLMGPGRAQEHVNPRVIATWDGREAIWQPEPESGPAALIRALNAPALAAGLPSRSVEGKRGYVWHCSARVAAGDRVLSDGEWAEIARELLDGSGVAARGDAGGPRWAAVRHADDHIHIAVVLVRQDDCRRFWPPWDYPRLRATANRIEKRLGLTITAAADCTAAKAPGRGETEKALRQGREPARVELARAVRKAAVASTGVEEFVGALEAAGYVVALRLAPSGDPLGFTVGRRGDVTAAGEQVLYSGSKLAPDLSLPRLMASWRQVSGGREVRAPVDVARIRVDRARGAVRAVRRGRGSEDPGEIAHAALDVLTAVGGWSPALASAAEEFDRAARSPRGHRAGDCVSGVGLRRVARQLLRQRRTVRVSGDPDAASVALAVAVAALLREVALWQREVGRPHQAHAADAAATQVGRWVGTWSLRQRVESHQPGLFDHAGVDRRPRAETPTR